MMKNMSSYQSLFDKSFCNDKYSLIRCSIFSELKKTFQMFDRDGNGTISASELGHAFRVQGQNFSEMELRQIIKEIDEDGEFQLYILLVEIRCNDLESLNPKQTYYISVFSLILVAQEYAQKQIIIFSLPTNLSLLTTPLG